VAISAPTLLVSAEDDRFLTAENARYLAGVIPGAEALILPDGGHVWVGHDAEVFAAIDGFLRRAGAA
jgi:pimeloyl-ACP methyl ester carboxylesterase